MYLVEGVVSVDEDEIIKILPQVFDGWSLPQPMQLDKGLDSWFEYGLEVTLETTKRKAKKDDHPTIVRILNATHSVNGEKEFDLHVALWLESGVLKKLAPCLLDDHNRNSGAARDFKDLPCGKKEAGIKSAAMRLGQLRRSARIQNRRLTENAEKRRLTLRDLNSQQVHHAGSKRRKNAG
ncbi:hypothetical protein N7537_010405 [Penicillium hordei]|uniref:Uncharacterized protein n=1 Tax=Penicillium hordei TaxID=40994 RepID=A0AAD6DUM2_9EURO|nr:uncharacterized protein N7537_010405 [Penicillium hordei]KAJ5593501.1 hypothetical protein N7537_010405 [Penicillium hordei]